jgi:hypothetical protein
MKRFGLLAGLVLLVSSLAAPVAQAVTVSLTASDPLQLGRLSRNGVPQDFAGDEAYPGVVNPTTPYHFHAYSLNVGNTPFVEIIVDSLSTSVFYSAYRGSYHPSNMATNWLGDAGTSGNDFGTDPLYFDVFVGMNNTLVLLVNETLTNGGLNMPPAGLFITGYTDNSYDGAVDLTPLLSGFALVIPEPSTLALFGLPLVALGFSARRRRKTA